MSAARLQSLLFFCRPELVEGYKKTKKDFRLSSAAIGRENVYLAFIGGEIEAIILKDKFQIINLLKKSVFDDFFLNN